MIDIPTTEIFSQAGSPRGDAVNEDAWLFSTVSEPNCSFAAVIDGVSARIPDSFSQTEGGMTSGARVARAVRDSILNDLFHNGDLHPWQMLMNANNAVRNKLYESRGVSLEDLAQSLSDPRYIRLRLPACVVTLIKVFKDQGELKLEFAHAGDTMLLTANTDKSFRIVTTDQMGQYDSLVLQNALEMVRDQPNASFRSCVESDSVRHLNIMSALRHNFVDENGHPDRGRGCGVLNGLQTLGNYIETGILDLRGVDFLCVMSDGMIWPADKREIELEHRKRLLSDQLGTASHVSSEGTATATELEVVEEMLEIHRLARFQKMSSFLRHQGLSSFASLVRRILDNDPSFESYPRMKERDDATGILFRFR